MYLNENLPGRFCIVATQQVQHQASHTCDTELVSACMKMCPHIFGFLKLAGEHTKHFTELISACMKICIISPPIFSDSWNWLESIPSICSGGSAAKADCSNASCSWQSAITELGIVRHVYLQIIAYNHLWRARNVASHPSGFRFLPASACARSRQPSPFSAARIGRWSSTCSSTQQCSSLFSTARNPSRCR